MKASWRNRISVESKDGEIEEWLEGINILEFCQLRSKITLFTCNELQITCRRGNESECPTFLGLTANGKRGEE